ncbi:hypothetical protein H8B09_08605 [Paenibacillus sp. PR3]|uniref:Photosynthesis system II assembly factor Ycf48/Hcf136-like domain-containing protein n=1 Tax=Paenibacillus terricola TaxID=2763503 RepID=A0ABR8MS41_9BACL|nr:hypothetical protein [Paenibacillus terricola]MBD3918808.1 hypothetical protein [Paenibacillus terricola]
MRRAWYLIGLVVGLLAGCSNEVISTTEINIEPSSHTDADTTIQSYLVEQSDSQPSEQTPPIPYDKIAQLLPIQEPWEQQLSESNVYFSFHSVQSTAPDWILLVSDPAMGLMEKRLYKSLDHGDTWSFVHDVSITIDGYVTGITFRDDQNGWITASQHGQELVPLYRTSDGGLTWSAQSVAIPEGFNYGNVDPPTFQDEAGMNGTLNIEFVNDNDRKTFHYVTNDGGETWVTD